MDANEQSRRGKGAKLRKDQSGGKTESTVDTGGGLQMGKRKMVERLSNVISISTPE